MRIGFVELVLLLFIASITIGPNVALFVDRWMRRAQRTSAAAARRKAQMKAQAAAEREAVLHRFRVLSNVFAVILLAALVYGLLLRPIDAPPKVYVPHGVEERSGMVLTADAADALALKGYQPGSAVRMKDGWLYAAASRKKVGVLLRMQPDGSSLTEVLDTADEITGFDFAPDGTLWMTTVSADGGKLCRVSNDQWGVTAEPVVSQIDGKALSCPTAAAVGGDGRIYFTEAAAIRAEYGAESALRTELFAHTATGGVYVYDPAARTVEQVLSGVAGAAGLAFSPDGDTLYVADLASRCIWAVPPDSRELTAGGKGCTLFADGLPGYPGSLAVDEDGTVYVGYRWERLSWLESHADGTLLRGAALRLSETMQKNLVSLPGSAICAERFSPDGKLLASYGGKQMGSAAALCPAGSRMYIGISGTEKLCWVRI